MRLYREICKAAQSDDVIVGFNVFGYEDAVEIVRAAEDCGRPVLLMTNAGAAQALAIEHWGKLLRSIADAARLPVGVHLDHCTDEALIRRAVDSGYTSVMYDGSRLPLAENIRNTKRVVQYAHQHNVMVEAEVGYVPYSDLGQLESQLTEPEEAQALAEQAQADLLAVSVGNIHRLSCKAATIQFDVLERIEQAVQMPLVIHGASGITQNDLQRLKKHRVGKINVGTVVRQAFANELRRQLALQPDEFDRLKLFAEPRQSIYRAACALLRAL